jgi:hypothetical protein
MKFKHLLLIIIFGTAFLVRFYNYENRITFGPEQAMSLITSGRMITEKFTLLGNQNLLRETSSGHSLFAGAIFNYSLIPLQIIFNFEALPITSYFTLLNLLSALILYFVTKKIFGEKVAIFTIVLFLFNAISVYHSMFIWNQNYAFLLGALTIYYLYLLKMKVKIKYFLILGLLSGIGYTFQDVFIFSAFFVLFIALVFAKNKKILNTVIFSFGMITPNLPAIVFDLRHDFYHLKTSFQFLVDTLSGNANDTSLSYYHFLYLLPVAVLVGGLITEKVFTRSRILGGGILITYLYFNLNSSWINYKAPTGMPSELTLKNINRAAEIIAKEEFSDYNIAVLVDFDTRGHILRYPLEFKYKLKPLGVIEYPQSSRLYILSEYNYDFEDSSVWELSTFPRNKAELLSEVSDNYSVFIIEK